jgi:hypothetical protein
MEKAAPQSTVPRLVNTRDAAEIRGAGQQQHSSAGGSSGGATIPFDHDKLEKLFAMIAQGLAWPQWKVLLRPGFSAIASHFSDTGAPFFMQMLSGWNTPVRVSANLGNGTFVYEDAQATDVSEATIWWFQMYGGIAFGGDPRSPRSCIARGSPHGTGLTESSAASIDRSAPCGDGTFWRHRDRVTWIIICGRRGPGRRRSCLSRHLSGRAGGF